MPRPGETNNAAGRPPGRGVVAQMRAELVPGDKLKTLVQKVYDLALAGDMAAANIILSRVFPPLRAQVAPVHVAMPEGATMTDQALLLVRAATNGTLPPDVASELINAIAKAAGVEEVDQLRRRIETLEAQLHGDLA